MQPFILLLEDLIQDAFSMLSVAKALQKALGGKADENTRSEEELLSSAELLKAELAHCGVCWLRTLTEFREAEPQRYALWIMDLRMEENGAIQTYGILRENASRPVKAGQGSFRQTPDIWVLSHYAHLEDSVRQYLSVQRFYPKTDRGYARLQNDLIRRFGGSGEKEGDLVFTMASGLTERFWADDVVAIVSDSRSGDYSSSHRRRYYLYALGGSQQTVIPYLLSDKEHSIREMLSEAAKAGHHEFVQVSRNMIVNVRQIVRVEAADGEWRITLPDVTEGESVPVRGRYLKTLAAALKGEVYDE